MNTWPGYGKSILVYDRNPNEHIPHWLSNFIGYLWGMGYRVDTVGGVYSGDIRQYTHIFMWNGNLQIHKPIKDAAASLGIPVTIIEVGWFPQTNFYTLDSVGINAKSSLMTDNLSWITDQHLRKLDVFANAYLGDCRWFSPGKYVLCPLQLEFDTNVIEHSPYLKMQEFIEHVEAKFPNDEIIFKTHPVRSGEQYRTQHRIIRSGDFNQLATHAKVVYGINSTCLLQSTMMGIPTESIGDGFLKTHADKKRQLLAALVDKQIPVGKTDLDYWVKPFLERTS